MANNRKLRATMLAAAFNLAPPSLRESLLDQEEWQQDNDAFLDAVISLGDSRVAFRRSKLFSAIRGVFAKSHKASLKAEDNENWTLSVEPEMADRVIVRRDDQSFVLPDSTYFAAEPAKRLNGLNSRADEANLPVHAREEWAKILAERPLRDHEVELYEAEFRDTPIRVISAILDDLERGTGNIKNIAPSARRYYDRLVGAFDGSHSVSEYAINVGPKFFNAQIDSDPLEGFLMCLFCSAHSAMTDVIPVERLSDNELEQAFERIVHRGDPLSQLGAIEIGMRVIDARPILGSYLRVLIEKIRDCDVGENSRLAFFGAMWVLCDSELSRMRTFGSAPPFIRRLAAIAQASLVTRQIAGRAVELSSVRDWALGRGVNQFYAQTLIDLRSDPRWNPEFVAPEQIKADFAGRIMIAARNHHDKLSPEVRELVLGSGGDCLQILFPFPRPFFSGPLEGGIESPNMLPEEIAEAIREQLATDEGEPASFIALVNSAPLFHLGPEHADYAAEALRLARHRLADVEDPNHLYAILSGLATVAAVTRSEKLAQELRILTRVYRRDPEFRLTVDNCMVIGLTAAACHQEHRAWTTFVGEWITELAFGELRENEVTNLGASLDVMLHLEPELWGSCSRAHAALSSL